MKPGLFMIGGNIKRPSFTRQPLQCRGLLLEEHQYQYCLEIKDQSFDLGLRG